MSRGLIIAMIVVGTGGVILLGLWYGSTFVPIEPDLSPLGESEELVEPTQPSADTPTICTDIFAPVCGSDNQTYSNACRAAQAGVSIAAAGTCS